MTRDRAYTCLRPVAVLWLDPDEESRVRGLVNIPLNWRSPLDFGGKNQTIGFLSIPFHWFWIRNHWSVGDDYLMNSVVLCISRLTISAGLQQDIPDVRGAWAAQAKCRSDLGLLGLIWCHTMDICGSFAISEENTNHKILSLGLSYFSGRGLSPIYQGLSVAYKQWLLGIWFCPWNNFGTCFSVEKSNEVEWQQHH